MQAVKAGGLGIWAACCPPDLAAMVSQWSNCDFSIASPSTVATALPGTPPHAATKTGRARRARTTASLFMSDVRIEISGGRRARAARWELDGAGRASAHAEPP